MYTHWIHETLRARPAGPLAKIVHANTTVHAKRVVPHNDGVKAHNGVELFAMLVP